MDIQTKKFAVLIDADNSSINAIASVLEEVAKYGIASVKRVYGDWSSETLKNWRDVLLPHAITPVQQFAYTKGKDATDMILIIDAMDLLYAGALDGFCIVSSDSDFTPLASRIRENGLTVYGFGKKATPEAFKKACDKFIYIEIIDLVETESVDSKTKLSVDKKNKLHQLIASSVNDLADDNGYVFMGDLGNLIMKKQPDFDPRNYGYYQLTPLIKALGQFDIDERRIPNSNVKHVYIRNK